MVRTTVRLAALLLLAGCASQGPVDAFGDTPAYHIVDLGPRSAFLKTWRFNPLQGTPFEEAWEKAHPQPSEDLPDSFERSLAYAIAKQSGQFPLWGEGSAVDMDEDGRATGTVTSTVLEDGVAVTSEAPAMYANGTTYAMQVPPSARPMGMNDKLQVVGSYRAADGSTQAFRWNGHGDTFMPLPADGASGRVATAINDDGVIVGHVSPFAGRKAFRRMGDSYELLPATTPVAYAQDINDDGVIVGREYTLANPKALRWVDGQLDHLPKTTDNQGLPVPSAANAVADDGTVVGWRRYQGVDVPAIWPATGGWFLIAGGNGFRGEALDVNSSGEAVGSARVAGGNSGPFAFHFPDFKDLNDHIPQGSDWHLTEAVAINEKGWIVGNGELLWRERVFLLVPWGDLVTPADLATVVISLDHVVP